MRVTTKAFFILCFNFCIYTTVAYGDPHTLRGAVVTPEGTMVPEFTVVIKPVVDKPELVLRKRFTNGLFRVEGLRREKYQIQVYAPRHVGVRMDVNFEPGKGSTHFRVVMLHKLRNEPRFVGPSYTVSARTLQQKVPQRAKDAYTRGVELHTDGRLEEALVAYGEAIRHYPDYVEALGDAGTVYILMNRPDSALIFLRRANRIDSANPIIRINIAVAMLGKREFDEAIRVLEQVLKDESRKSLPLYYLARAYFHQRRYDLAETTVRRALEESPAMLDGWLLLVNLALEKRDYPAAREGLWRLRGAMNNKQFTEFIEDQIASLND